MDDSKSRHSPPSDSLRSCFFDGSIHIWSTGSLIFRISHHITCNNILPVLQQYITCNNQFAVSRSRRSSDDMYDVCHCSSHDLRIGRRLSYVRLQLLLFQNCGNRLTCGAQLQYYSYLEIWLSLQPGETIDMKMSTRTV
jgi:hypothetical protein